MVVSWLFMGFGGWEGLAVDAGVCVDVGEGVPEAGGLGDVVLDAESPFAPSPDLLKFSLVIVSWIKNGCIAWRLGRTNWLRSGSLMPKGRR
jgi:hypothetical protein